MTKYFNIIIFISDEEMLAGLPPTVDEAEMGRASKNSTPSDEVSFKNVKGQE